jgi:HSP20 family protein
LEEIMPLKDLIPWNRQSTTPEIVSNTNRPFVELWGQMNQLFDGFARNAMQMTPGEEEQAWGLTQPRVDIAETEEAIEVTAELPGMNDKDIELTLSSSNNALILKGEKKVESEREEKGVYRTERYYGAIERAIPLPCVVEAGKIEATFKDGVLKVTLPRCEEYARKAMRIEVKTS